METYPIMIDGELAGKLTVERQGARTVFDAECRPLQGVVRISVYGGGKEGPLGVLAPGADGKLRLHKSLSRNAMREFPGEIERAERSGMEPMPESEEETEQAQGAGTPHGDTSSEGEPDTDVPGEDVPEEKTKSEAPAPAEQEGLFWYSSPDGALVCFDGAQTLLALPEGDPRIPTDAAGEQRSIEGRNYVVFRTRDGRIVRE